MDTLLPSDDPKPANEHERRAVALALAQAKARKDCDVEPTVTEIDRCYDGFVLVDVAYDAAGHRALYEYRKSDGNFSLAQD